MISAHLSTWYLRQKCPLERIGHEVKAYVVPIEGHERGDAFGLTKYFRWQLADYVSKSAKNAL